MQEALVFMDALRAAVPTQPDPGLGAGLVPRLAEAARSSTLEAETRVTRRAAGVVRRPRSRRALVARVGIAIAVIPLVLAGLAFAGVTVPSPARSAFDSVGIDLPNQPSKKSDRVSSEPSQPSTEGTGTPAAAPQGSAEPSQGGAPSKGNSKAAHEHARAQHQKAQGKAKGHSRGKAVGLNDAVPPGHSGQTGPPAHSNTGGNGGSSQGNSTAKAPKAPHTPNGVANGHSKIPPGHSK
jgi:hypothetical protein